MWCRVFVRFRCGWALKNHSGRPSILQDSGGARRCLIYGYLDYRGAYHYQLFLVSYFIYQRQRIPGALNRGEPCARWRHLRGGGGRKKKRTNATQKTLRKNVSRKRVAKTCRENVSRKRDIKKRAAPRAGGHVTLQYWQH